MLVTFRTNNLEMQHEVKIVFKLFQVEGCVGGTLRALVEMNKIVQSP